MYLRQECGNDAFKDSKLTHTLVNRHTVLVVIGEVGFVLLPSCVGDWCAVHPAAGGQLSFLLHFVDLFQKKSDAELAYLNDLSKFTNMPI